MSFPRAVPLQGQFIEAPKETVFSVAEYIALLNITIKPLKATIHGEIGKIKYYPKAVYFSIFDKGRTVLNCVVWLSRLNSLGIDLKEGMEVKIQGYPDVYPMNGLLTFKADVITPLGEGALKLAFERLKKDLATQGYFRQDRKRSLPHHIERIGLITSGAGVVIQDFLTGVGNHGVKIYFYDVRVEGANAIEDIGTAIQWFNENSPDVQALVIARGGGSLERMQPFNSLEIAKAIYSSKIPVMTAIGHELDVTIADLVADVRASVPLDAGKQVAEQWVQAAERVATIEGNILFSFKNACRAFEIKLRNFDDNGTSCFAMHLAQNKKQIDDYQNNLTRCFRDMLLKIKRIEENFNNNYQRFSLRLSANKQTITAMDDSLLHEAERFFKKIGGRMIAREEQFIHNFTRLHRYLRSLNQDVSDQEKQITREAQRWFLAIGKKIADCEKILLACDPHLKLKQGYSIVKDGSGKVVKTGKSVRVRDILSVQLFAGILTTKVEEIQ